MVGGDGLVESTGAHEFVGDLLKASDSGGRDWIEAVLEWSARTLNADQAWLLLDEPADGCRTWPSADALLATKAKALTQSAIARFGWRNDRIVIAPNRRSEIVSERPRWRQSSVRASLMLLRLNSQDETAILGLSGRRALHVRPETTQAVSTVLQETLRLLSLHRTDRRRWAQAQGEVIERRMETIGAFASGIAHNLNNVIAAIAGFNAITEMHVAPDSVAGRSAVDIEMSVKRAQEMVGEVLSFGRRLERTSLTVDIGDLLSETAAMLAVSLPSRIKLERVESAEKWHVRGKFGHLQQVLLNIFNNAAQAMVDGGTIRVECRSVVLREVYRTSLGLLAPGSYVMIRVVDGGAGISPPIAERIFDPFFTTRETGTGLGLSTAYKIVAQHDGAIDVHSLPGEGSIFTVLLPAESPRFTAEENIAPRGSGEVVLVVNADAARLIIDEELVAALGYEPSGVCEITSLGNAEGKFDALLIAGIASDKILAALDAVQQTGWSIPIVVAAAEPATIKPVSALSYPLRRGELAIALSRAFFSSSDSPSASEVGPDDIALGLSGQPLPRLFLPRKPSEPQALVDERGKQSEDANGATLLTSAPLQRLVARDPAGIAGLGAVLRFATADTALLTLLSVALLGVAFTGWPARSPSAGKPRDLETETAPRRAVAQFVPIKREGRADRPSALPANSSARPPRATFALARAGGEHISAASEHRRRPKLRLAVAVNAKNAHPLALLDRPRSTHGKPVAVRPIATAVAHPFRSFKSGEATGPVICRRYIAERWTTIGFVPALDCVRAGFALRTTSYVQVGEFILSRRASQIFRVLQGVVRPVPSGAAGMTISTGVLDKPLAGLSSSSPVVCRRFDGSSWRKLGTMTPRYCAEQAFAKPGTGYVQSGALSLSRHDDRIGILQGTRWQAIAKIFYANDTRSSIKLRKL